MYCFMHNLFRVAYSGVDYEIVICTLKEIPPPLLYSTVVLITLLS